MTSNNALDRTVKQRGRAVLAMDCVLAGAEVLRGTTTKDTPRSDA